jgi:NAD(P)-dependent dehydrogenase (short-subunit alcohol dehydrogenase family)
MKANNLLQQPAAVKTPFNYDTSSKTIAELVSLKGKTAVITGSAKGVGYAVAERLAEAGASIVIADINLVNADLAAQKIAKKYSADTSFFLLDPSGKNSIASLISQVMETCGHIDIWVNNAGIFPYVQALELTDDDMDHIMDKNLKGIFIGCREAAKQMIEAGRGGVIINLVSGIAFKNQHAVSEHLAAKYGIISLTKAFAAELGGRGIRVLAVAPSTLEGHALNGNSLQTPANDNIMNALPLGRTAIPDDIARVVLFCASDLSMFMTGTVLTVDGGEINF